MDSIGINENRVNIENEHHHFMLNAQEEAMESLNNGGIPIGAVLVKDGEIIGKGHNKRIQLDSPILHAEMECLESAGRMKAEEYKKCTLYTTLSPCEMCSGAILLYNIPVVVIGENENFKGPEDYLKDNGVKLINLNLNSCKNILGNFIEMHPEVWNEDISL